MNDEPAEPQQNLDQPTRVRPPVGLMFSRAIRLRCPRCGEGRLFSKWLSMPKNCSQCNLQYERAPGYFLGSTYINYALTAFTLTILYVSLHFIAGIENRILAVPLGLYCLLFPLLVFRFARSFWLAIDCFCDTAGFEQDHD